MRCKAILLRDQNKDFRLYSKFKKKPLKTLKWSLIGWFTKKHTLAALESMSWEGERGEKRGYYSNPEEMDDSQLYSVINTRDGKRVDSRLYFGDGIKYLLMY